MTLEEIQADEALRQREFPVTREKLYLAHAAVCALPRRASEAIARYVEGALTTDQEFVLPGGWLRETRQIAAEFLGAKAEEIAFVGPTSNGLSAVAAGLQVKRNQNVVVYFDDYPSNVYPWMAMAERGVEVRFLNIRELGVIRPRDITGQVDENTRLVALASCHFLTGYRIDLEAIGRALRERGILFCVDAIQTLGASPVNFQFVDFAAADAHKWLLGPLAAGLLYVRQEVQDQLRPGTHGWHNIRSPDFVAQEELQYKPDARRYEAGSHNLLGLVGLRASLELLREIGVGNIARDLLRKREWLVAELERKGCAVLNAHPPRENAGPIISFFKPGNDMSQLHADFERLGIVTSLRTDRSRQRYIRLSPHFYNTNQELERFLSCL